MVCLVANGNRAVPDNETDEGHAHKDVHPEGKEDGNERGKERGERE